jgi:hypothetical protein
LENSHSKNITGSRTRLMLSYGLGDAGTGLAATQFGFFLFRFFICSAGLPVLIAGSLLMLIKIWDAINDPLIGWLSDRTKSRWGPKDTLDANCCSASRAFFGSNLVDPHRSCNKQNDLLYFDFNNSNDCLYKY